MHIHLSLTTFVVGSGVERRAGSSARLPLIFLSEKSGALAQKAARFFLWKKSGALGGVSGGRAGSLVFFKNRPALFGYL